VHIKKIYLNVHLSYRINICAIIKKHRIVVLAFLWYISYSIFLIPQTYTRLGVRICRLFVDCESNVVYRYHLRTYKVLDLPARKIVPSSNFPWNHSERTLGCYVRGAIRDLSTHAGIFTRHSRRGVNLSLIKHITNS